MSVIENDSEEASRVFGFPRGVHSRELNKPWSFGLGDRRGVKLGPWIQFHPDHWRERRSCENKNVWEPRGTAHLPEETPPQFLPAIGDATKDEGEAVAYTNKIVPH